MDVVCTLFDGDYYIGAGALINSLIRGGFTGEIILGYRGEPPKWLPTTVERQAEELRWEIREGVLIRCVPIQTERHLTNYKPNFFKEVVQKISPELERLYYFDPDIVIKAPWSYMREWADLGVAVCCDSTHTIMPPTHPLRLRWAEYAAKHDLKVAQQLHQYINGGFVGIQRNYFELIDLWQRLLDGMEDEGVDLRKFGPGNRLDPFFATDQDALNIALMVFSHSASPMGPEAMDFWGGGYVMSHMFGTKFWRKSVLKDALRGFPPQQAQKVFARYMRGPINVYTPQEQRRLNREIALGSLIGRFYRRS